MANEDKAPTYHRFCLILVARGRAYEVAFTNEDTGVKRKVRITFPLRMTGLGSRILCFLLDKRFLRWSMRRAQLQFERDGAFRALLMPEKMRISIVVELFSLMVHFETLRSMAPRAAKLSRKEVNELAAMMKLGIREDNPLIEMFDKLQ